MKGSRNKVCVILGPTATKKSKLAVWLAEKIDGEIVSADSMQIYKEMNIATAKIEEKEKKNIKHYMLDFLEIEKEFSVAQYVEMAKKIIEKILKKNKKPIIVGGTGLYIDCLLFGTNFKSDVKSLELREELEEELKNNGADFMFEKLKKKDPEYAKKIHKNNTKRVLRAIEILTLTNKSIEEYIKENNEKEESFNSLKIGLNYKDRNILYKNINNRVDLMIEKGLLEEAKKIISKNPSKTAMQAIGYKELKKYFNNEITLEEAIFKIKQNSTRYAKRQLTWFRRDKKVHWFFWDEKEDFLIKDEILNLTKNFFK